MSKFSKRFKSLREGRGLTQDQAAELLGISRSTIAGYESEDKNRIPRKETLTNIADLFGTNIDYLLGRDTKEEEIVEETEADVKRKQGLEYIKQIKDEKTLDLAIELLEKLAKE